jgi:hypothetical protein
LPSSFKFENRGTITREEPAMRSVTAPVTAADYRPIPDAKDRQYQRAPPPSPWLGQWIAARSGSSPPLTAGTSGSPKRAVCTPRTFATSNALLWMAAEANNFGRPYARM